jgi:hypothetical protein
LNDSSTLAEINYDPHTPIRVRDLPPRSFTQEERERRIAAVTSRGISRTIAEQVLDRADFDILVAHQILDGMGTPQRLGPCFNEDYDDCSVPHFGMRHNILGAPNGLETAVRLFAQLVPDRTEAILTLPVPLLRMLGIPQRPV